MKGWTDVRSIEAFDQALIQPQFQSVVIFKHSTRCSISSMAERRLSSLNTAEFPQTAFLFLDLIAHREVSNHISEVLQETHQSPQVLVVKQGQCTYDATHMEINVPELIEAIRS
jgi:bacillithiol system protein YtxJ